MQGNHPARPSLLAGSDELWEFMQRCWNKEPLLRPRVSEVFQVLPGSDLENLRRLCMSGMASHEFQLALGRFYGSSEYQDRIDNLHGPDLERFVDFLDTVRQSSSLFHPKYPI